MRCVPGPTGRTPNTHAVAAAPSTQTPPVCWHPQIKVVLGIRNDAIEPYNVSAVMGSLNSPIDFKRYFYNFTQQVRTQIA